MKTLIVIPARFGSTRFPGKPLHKIGGRTMVERVANIAKRTASGADVKYTVATDHQDILEYCRALEIPVLLTSKDLKNGSERALEAAHRSGENPDFVVNLQGDVPFSEPSHIQALIGAASTQPGDVFTPVISLSWEKLDDLRLQKLEHPFSGTTCVRAADGMALWFSKQILPAIRDEQKMRETDRMSPVFRHVGLYGYKLAALERFCGTEAGHYEQLEGLEQLRFLENRMTIRAIIVDAPRISMSGIDSPEDAAKAEEMIKKYGDPFEE